MCWGNWFLPWVSSFPLSTAWREQCIAVFDFKILSTSTERPIFPPRRSPSVWSKSVATLNVLLPLLSLHCVSFEIESTDGAGLPFACFPAKSISCVPVVVILYGCVWISTFRCCWNHWFYGEFYETGACSAVMWTAWFGSWLLLTSVLSKARGVKTDGRTHSYNKVAVTDEHEFFCSAVKICKVRKRMAAGF